MPSCHKCPHTNYRPWPDNGMIPKWGNGKGGIKASEAEWEDTPCSECDLDDDKPNNQGKTFISLDALCGDNGVDFDDAETGESSRPPSEFERRQEELVETMIARDIDAKRAREIADDYEQKQINNEIASPEYIDIMDGMLDVFGYISKLNDVAKSAVLWKLNDPFASFAPLAEQLEVTTQYCNQSYLKALQELPVLGHCLKNRSAKVEKYKSHHVKDAQDIANILKGL